MVIFTQFGTSQLDANLIKIERLHIWAGKGLDEFEKITKITKPSGDFC
jgi:hypothetical protein